MGLEVHAVEWFYILYLYGFTGNIWPVAKHCWFLFSNKYTRGFFRYQLHLHNSQLLGTDLTAEPDRNVQLSVTWRHILYACVIQRRICVVRPNEIWHPFEAWVWVHTEYEYNVANGVVKRANGANRSRSHSEKSMRVVLGGMCVMAVSWAHLSTSRVAVCSSTYVYIYRL